MDSGTSDKVDKITNSLLWMTARLVHVKLIMTRCTLIHKGGCCRRSVLRSYVENAWSRNSLSQEYPKYTGDIFWKVDWRVKWDLMGSSEELDQYVGYIEKRLD